MIYLIEAARELGLENILSQIKQHESVHGVIIDIDPWWLCTYKRYITGKRNDDYFHPKYGIFNVPLSDLFYETTVPIDINWRPEHWYDFKKEKSNLIVKILLKPGSEHIDFKEDGKLNIVQEYRAIPVLNSVLPTRPLIGGVSIGTSNLASGTLGGILKDTESNSYFGITCGHVIETVETPVDQPALIDGGATAYIGKSIYLKQPENPSTSLCTPYDPHSVFNDMDLSLIKIEEVIPTNLEVHNTGKVDDYTRSSRLLRNTFVEYNGRTSGHRTLVLGGIGVTNNVLDNNGNMYCFEHLIELKDTSVANLSVKPPTMPGDSGAWVMLQGDKGTEWCGMVIGGDRQTGYCIMSDKIMTHLSANGYPNLTCSHKS